MSNSHLVSSRRLLLKGAIASSLAAAMSAAAQTPSVKREGEKLNREGVRRNLGVVSPLMRTLSTYIAQASTTPLPDAITEETKHHLLDTLAAMISGTRLRPGGKAIEYVKRLGGTEEACVPGTNIITSVVNAALTGGMLAQADETDDTHPLSGVHLGSCVVPAALAMSEWEQSSGTALLRAIALGYDIGARLSLSIGGSTSVPPGRDPATVRNRGSFGGMFGSASACASLANANVDQVRYVLSYTAQQASGLGNFAQDLEHIEKAFQMGGMPARNGAFAATVVAMGWTGVNDVFSGDKNFFIANGPNTDPEALVRDLGKVFEVARTTIKRWSVGAPAQAPLDSLYYLIKTYNLKAENVERMVIRISHLGAYTVDNSDMANVSMQYEAAVMLLDGTITFASAHDQARVKDPKVMELRNRIELHGDDDLDRAMPVREGIVELKLRDGRELRNHTKLVRGMPDNPMTREEVAEKCFPLIASVLGDRRSRELIETIWRLEQLPDMRVLRKLMMA